MKTKEQKTSGKQSNNSPFFNAQNGTGFLGIQPKLNIGKPGDKYEQEADQVSDKVVQHSNEEHGFFGNSVFFGRNISTNIQEKPLAETISPLIQRQEEEEEAQPKLIQRQEEEEEMMQMHPMEEEESEQISLDSSQTIVNSSLESKLKNSSGNGQKMDAKTKAEMENSFGADFSGVKIHAGNAAVRMNKELGAQAFTSGNDIYFNEGKYQTNSESGKRLLAHELTHTIQQGATKVASSETNVIQRENGTVETSEGVEEIEGMQVTSSAEDIRLRLLTEQSVINETINRWVRENFDFVATSMRTAAESFENWYGTHSSSNDTTFVFDVISGGLGILSAAYPPAGIAAAILGAVVNIAKTARDSQNAANNIERGTAATVVEQSMINKSEELRNSSIGFAERLKARNENIWNNAGVGITMNDRGVEAFAKQEFYREVGITPVNADLTRRALTDMIHAYTNWERGNSLRSSVFFVSSRDLEWAFQSEAQRRSRAALRAREQLEVGNSQ